MDSLSLCGVVQVKTSAFPDTFPEDLLFALFFDRLLIFADSRTNWLAPLFSLSTEMSWPSLMTLMVPS